MNDTESNLEYVSNVLKKSEQRTGIPPSVFCLWGVIIFLGYLLAELPGAQPWLNMYWICAIVIGGGISTWLGIRAVKRSGQCDLEFEKRFGIHFFIMVLFLLTAMFTDQYLAILLIVGLAYAFGGLHLDKVLYFVGAISWIAYVAIFAGFIKSPLLVGTVYAIAFFVSALAAHRANKLTL